MVHVPLEKIYKKLLSFLLEIMAQKWSKIPAHKILIWVFENKLSREVNRAQNFLGLLCGGSVINGACPV